MITDDRLLADAMNQLQTISGYERTRDYLSMSAIGQCRLRQYRAFLYGRIPIDGDHRMCYVGYLFERDARARLRALGLSRAPDPAEIVAPFDARFRGHPDEELTDGRLIDFKSVSEEKFRALSNRLEARPEHYAQMQAYLRYGGWPSGVLLYIARDSFRHLPICVSKNDEIGAKLEKRAQAILRAIDARQPPACECGLCGREEVYRD